ncbi:MAG: 30S ribosomal protein S18 [Candidatus Yanofskybacteria bacterium]|nr:30S ribosomal protein S18 [Candidatus Yanofskybacteria bacterium]
MVCDICQEKVNTIDYKEVKLLRKFVSGQFKIIPAKRNHLCPKHQRQITQAVKNARYMALMPYTRNQTRK